MHVKSMLAQRVYHTEPKWTREKKMAITGNKDLLQTFKVLCIVLLKSYVLVKNV